MEVSRQFMSILGQYTVSLSTELMTGLLSADRASALVKHSLQEDAAFSVCKTKDVRVFLVPLYVLQSVLLNT